MDEERWAAMAEATEETGEVFSAFMDIVIARINELRDPAGGLVMDVLDIGCGPGVAATAFALAYPQATVTAADSSAGMLARAQARATRLGLSNRVTTASAELPDKLGALKPADVVWASMALHHVGDEVAALRSMAALLKPGGFVVISEFPQGQTPMSMLPELRDSELQDLRARVDAAAKSWYEAMRNSLEDSKPSRSIEEMAAEAGLATIDSRTELVRLTAPLSEKAVRMLSRNMVAITEQFEDRLDPADVELLKTLVNPSDPRSVLNRPDLQIESRRLLVFLQLS